MTANFNKETDAAKFEKLAPLLAREPSIKQGWGVLNIAQCSQQNGEAETSPCWSLEYLQESFSGQIGGLDREHFAELRAIWIAAGGTAPKFFN